MKKENIFSIETLRQLAASEGSQREILSCLLDVWADQKSVDFNNSLLKNLVLRYAEAEKKLKVLNDELKTRQKTMTDELEAAAGIQKTLLPQAVPRSESVEAAFEFLPCDQVGGDLVGLVPYDEDRWLAWGVDVAGHGPRAAMITVSVAQFLQMSVQLNSLGPADVMKALDREFPFSRFNSFFTIIYGILDLKNQIFTYCNSGHPNPVLLQPGENPQFVEGSGPMLGLGLPIPWPEVSVDLSGGKSLLLYTDGLIECADARGQLFGEDRLLEMLNRLQCRSANCLAASIMQEMHAFMGKVRFQDDFTFLALKSKSSSDKS